MRYSPQSSQVVNRARTEENVQSCHKRGAIRIPAEYIRKDKSLNEHIDRFNASAEGRFDDVNRLSVTSNHEPTTEGELFTETVLFTRVRFDAVLFLH